MTDLSFEGLVPFQENLLEKISNMAVTYSSLLVAAVGEDLVSDPFKTAVNLHFVTSSGPCEIWIYPDGAQVIWGEKVAIFEPEDHPQGGMEEAVLKCLELVFSGDARRDPRSFPTAGGCMLVPTFPFIWPLGKVYRGLENRKKKKREREQ